MNYWQQHPEAGLNPARFDLDLQEEDEPQGEIRDMFFFPHDMPEEEFHALCVGYVDMIKRIMSHKGPDLPLEDLPFLEGVDPEEIWENIFGELEQEGIDCSEVESECDPDNPTPAMWAAYTQWANVRFAHFLLDHDV